MNRKIMEPRISLSELYAKIRTGPRHGQKGAKSSSMFIELQLSASVVREYNLRMGEKVNIFWDSYNEFWECPVLILRRGGSHRVLSSNRALGTTPSYLKLSIALAVNQLHIPLLKHKLPILDYVDNEIWIDFTPRIDERKKRRKEKEIKTERFCISFGQTEEMTARWGAMYKSAIKQAARKEGLSLNAMILRATNWYLEDIHPEIWHGLDKIIKNEKR